MVSICLPGWRIRVISLISPGGPPFPIATSEKFQKWSKATSLYQLILLIWFARVLPLSAAKIIHLSTTPFEGPGILASYAEQNQLGHIAEVEANTASVGSTILSNLVPNQVAFVLKAPGFQYGDAVWKESIGDP